MSKRSLQCALALKQTLGYEQVDTEPLLREFGPANLIKRVDTCMRCTVTLIAVEYIEKIARSRSRLDFYADSGKQATMLRRQLRYPRIDTQGTIDIGSLGTAKLQTDWWGSCGHVRSLP
jgi:hypothetical protein